ncbi:Spermidine/putrescine import ATP-binding protein PotA [Stieleria varia]|uniref:Spermidine/putrescine import ATP-binding protein PotA n=2 Tax=Stieleria varia TaxID=2528005 RepID=A0A5C6B2Z5_9BACT|nr:Spermidine/putrescine import ATP-binding protein PotA [Stieleria varia]
MGRTGLGKTTILESICGLRRVTAGKVLIGGIDMTHWLPGDRQIGYVPQDLALFPTLSVEEHLAFALRLRKWPTAEIRSRVAELSDVLGIRHLLLRSVAMLSGGESQRVALGRAISFRPAVLLLDEPLSALDESTRGEMQNLLLQIKQTTGVTALHVTHSSEEANALADYRLLIDSDGIKGLKSKSP